MKGIQSPFPCKLIWGSRQLEDELKRKQQEIKNERGFTIPVTALTHQLANDMRDGKIIIDPKVIKFKNRPVVVFGEQKVRIPRKNP